jgi:hypothetical protein
VLAVPASVAEAATDGVTAALDGVIAGKAPEAPGAGERGRVFAWFGCRWSRGFKEGVLVSVRKVVPTLTSMSAEIYHLMAGAKQLSDTGFILVPVGAVRLAGGARGTVLHYTVVLAEGSYNRGGRGGGASRSLRFD